MKEDSGVKEQYSRISIFERIYQHCTTREQTTFTLNHHHTTTSNNSRLPENMPRPCIQVLPEQNNPDICLGLQQERYIVLLNNSDPRPSNFLFQIARGLGATLSECTFSFKKAHVTKRTTSRQQFFKRHKIQDPPTFCSK